MPAPKENQNAAKPDAQKATSFLHLRVRPIDKARWVKAAGRRGLAEWAIEKLNAASGQ